METIVENNIHQLDKNELRNQKVDRKDFRHQKRNPIYIVLDSLKCAHNIGTILRLSDATLVEKVYICGNTIIPPNRKIKDSARGAEKWVPWEYKQDVVELITDLKKQHITIVSLEIADKSIPYTELKMSFPICFVLGREYDGVNSEILKLSDYTIHLPICGMANSINVSTTAAVMLYEAIKQIQN